MDAVVSNQMGRKGNRVLAMATIEVSDEVKEVLDILIKAGDFKGYDDLINYLIEVALNALGEGGD